MRVDDFHYDLPPERIAQVPVEPRDAARMFVVDRSGAAGSAAGVRSLHRCVRDVPDFLREGDLLVVNDTRVVPARLVGRRAGGGRAEALILHRDGSECVGRLRPGRKARPGEPWSMESGRLLLWPLEALDDGEFRFRLEVASSASPPGEPPPADPVGAVLEDCGRAPLPPYIDRADEDDPGRDRERYQTVFAREAGSAAAPTAGLHFNPELLERIEARGVRRVAVTLHVGAGTFTPMRGERVEEHRMHSEEYELSAEVEQAVRDTRARGGRVFAVGTTSTRTLETCAAGDGLVRAGRGATDLFLHPGRPPRVVDGLLTNFHLPRSTLIVLVAAFLGRETTLALYREAVERAYRFFSYGDAMLILPRDRAGGAADG